MRLHAGAHARVRFALARLLLAFCALSACGSPARAPEVLSPPSPSRPDARAPDAPLRDAAAGEKDGAAPDRPAGSDVPGCQEAVCCVGPGCPKRPLGTPCQQGDQCDSGACADGVCCAVACKGACVACNQPDRMGECVPIAAGEPDPHLLCRRDPPESCGQSGVCNGQGACAKFPPGTICGDSLCSNANTMMPGGECDGDGACTPGEPVDCTPFLCAGRTCRGSCTESSHCASPHVCVDGSCGKRGNGQNCGANTDCQSGFCTDGVCCESACTGRCTTCSSARARGSCVMVAAGTLDPRAAAGVTDPARVCLDQGPQSCGSNGRCDGKGGCEPYKAGTVCAPGRCDAGKNTATGSGVCRAGKCETPDARSCAPFAGCDGSRCSTQCGNDRDCAAGNVCINGSCGKRPLGATCSRNDECAGAGVCAQGRCCDKVCDKPCVACNVEGAHGTCTPVPAGGADPAGVCRNDACNGGCDGAGACRREKEGTTCGQAKCEDDGTLLTRTCDAQGACQDRARPCASEQSCKEGRCVAPVKRPPGETCVADGDCSSGACVGNHCCASACTTACKVCNADTGWKCADRSDETSCGGGQVCRGGKCGPKCTSSGKPTFCDPDCVDLVNDARHCGACGKKCDSGLCEKAVCAIVCAAGLLRCDGACFDTSKDERHCGGCGKACASATPLCSAGKCIKVPTTEPPPVSPDAGGGGKPETDAGNGKPQPDAGTKPNLPPPTPDAGTSKPGLSDAK